MLIDIDSCSVGIHTYLRNKHFYQFQILYLIKCSYFIFGFSALHQKLFNLKYANEIMSLVSELKLKHLMLKLI